MGKKYTYKGAVYTYGNNLMTSNWEASTWAISSAKAVANLKYRFRKMTGLTHQVPVSLPGKLTIS